MQTRQTVRLKTGTHYANTASGRSVQYESSQAMNEAGKLWRLGAGRLAVATIATLAAAAFMAAFGPARASGAALMLSVARAGHVVLAVGDRGTVLRSADDGGHFAPVPTPALTTLTRVVMRDGGLAYAVGFDATILRSEDSGAHWTRVFSDARGDNPLFGLVTGPAGSALAVGGFGRVLTSRNGTDWQPGRILDEDDDLHLNAALNVTDSTWLVVGEQALVMQTGDAGAHWRKFAMPVQGSLFGGVILSPRSWLVFGLRGHVMETDDAGAHWQAIDSGTTAELLGGTVLQDGRVLLAGNRGTLVVVNVAAHTARVLPRQGRENFADCVQLADGSVLAAGELGLTKIDVPAVAR